jgi:hypothetical protein
VGGGSGGKQARALGAAAGLAPLSEPPLYRLTP